MAAHSTNSRFDRLRARLHLPARTASREYVEESLAPRSVPSTRARILGWYLLAMALALIFGLYLLRQLLLSQVNDEVNAGLAQEVEEVRQLSDGRDPNTGQPFGNDIAGIFDTFLRRNIPAEGEALFTLIDGRPHASTVAPVQLFDDPEIVAEWAAVEDQTRREIDSPEGRVRYMAVPIRAEDGATGVFVVTNFLDHERQEIDVVIRDAAIVFGSIFIALSAGAWLAAGRILRPVSLVTNTARRITDSNLTDRIPVAGDDEIAELARTFNDMLDRLETAFSTQRAFIDDAGHELRTPITIIRGNLEVPAADPIERAESTRLVLDELDRMARIVDDLLLLAKSDHPDFLDPHPIDVADLTHETLAKSRRLGDRAWLLEGTAAIVMVADRQRLTQAVMNLTRNAVEHTSLGEQIAIGSRVDGTDVHIWVADKGEGIPYDIQPHIFRRFSRAASGQRTTEGAGLGLAIVEAIVLAHGGRVTVDSAPGIGSRVTLILPSAGPPETPK